MLEDWENRRVDYNEILREEKLWRGIGIWNELMKSQNHFKKI